MPFCGHPLCLAVFLVHLPLAAPHPLCPLRGLVPVSRLPRPGRAATFPGVKAKIQGSFTAIIHRSEKYWVALCPQLDVVSQGKTVEDARANLTEAVELFLETASPAEIKQRTQGEVYISALEPAVA